MKELRDPNSVDNIRELLQNRLRDFDFQLSGYAVDRRLVKITAGFVQSSLAPLDTLSLGLSAKKAPQGEKLTSQVRMVLLAHAGGLGALNTRGADGLAQVVTFHEHRVSHLELADAFKEQPAPFVEQNEYLADQFPHGGRVSSARFQHGNLSSKVSLYYTDAMALEIDYGPYAFLGFVVVNLDGSQLVVPSPVATLDAAGFENIGKINFATLTGNWA